MIPSLPSPLRTAPEQWPVVSFYAVTCTFSWSLQGAIASRLVGGPWRVALLFLSIFGPAVGAAVLVRARGGSVRRWLARAVRRSAPRSVYLYAVAVPLAFVAVHVALVRAADVPVELLLTPGHLLNFAAQGLLVFLLGGGQEEFGWRGFALPHLQERLEPVAASAVIAVLWVIWHVPAYYLFDTPLAGGSPPSPLLYLLTTVGLAYVLTVAFNAADGSVLPAMVLHASSNANGALYEPGANPTVAGFDAVGLLYPVAVLLVAGGVWLAVRYRSPAVEPVRWSSRFGPEATGE